MKKLILLLLFFPVSLIFAQPNITNISFPKQVDVYGLCEVSFNLGTYANPYNPEVIDVWGEFTSPDGRVVRVNGFYYEGYDFSENKGVEVASKQRGGDGWRIRFTTDLPGKWTFTIHAKDRVGERKSNAMTFESQAKEDAKGFIRKANARYLKQEVFGDNGTQWRSFFPVGPNVAWYSSGDYGKYTKPYGIYDYRKYIDLLKGNANYMRVWICRYQYLSLIGPEHAIRSNGKPTVYFDSTLNQKDAAELDDIVSYAAKNGINLMLCLHTHGELRDDSEGLKDSQKNGSMPSGWMYNPYHTQLGLKRPVEFFTDAKAKKMEKRLLRYIVARWGYATNVECWELWNEVANVYKNTELEGGEGQAIVDWHTEMAEYVRSIDPYGHLVSTSIGSAQEMTSIRGSLFAPFDVVQDHFYGNIQKSKSKEQMSYKLLLHSGETEKLYPNKPHQMGEYGLNNPVKGIDNASRDPQGFDLHNSLWSSLFSGSMGPASHWYWHYLTDQDLFGAFKPMKVFCDQLPILSEHFVATTTGTVEKNDLVFPNNLEVYYMVNTTEDTLLGWCQDDAFSYQSLRRLTDREGNNGHFVDDGIFNPDGYVYKANAADRPKPSSNSNSIRFNIDHQPVGTRYMVRWFDAETGLEMTSEATTAEVKKPLFGEKCLVINMPSSVRDLHHKKINNTFGDAVFIVTRLAE